MSPLEEIQEESGRSLTSRPKVERRQADRPGFQESKWDPDTEDRERLILFVDVHSGHIVGSVDESPEDEELSTRDFIEKYQKFYNLTYDDDYELV